MIPGSANPLLLAPAGGGYQVQRSLRFNSSDSAYLSKNYSTSPSDNKKITISMWVKRSKLDSGNTWYTLFWGYNGTSSYESLLSFKNDTIYIRHGGSSQVELQTTAVYRDTSAWYHIVLAIDTTQSTSTNRTKLYVNGDQVTTFSTANYPAQNSTLQYLYQNANNGIGAANQYGGYFDGYLADCHIIDGQQLTPSSFTEVSATTGQLIPKAYTGTFGTNGFWLKFSDNSAATAAALGNDYSGNNNDWTPNNLSVTAGAGNDSLVDTPTSYGTDTGVGGSVRGNYATWNPLSKSTNLTNGNLSVVQPSTTVGYRSSTIGMPSGKWYWEINIVKYANTVFGVVKNPVNIVESSDGMGWRTAGGFFTTSGSVAGSLSVTAGDLLGLAFNADTAALSFYKNGSFVITITSSADVGKTWFAASQDSGGGNSDHDANFGQRAFAYTAPSGFKALCDTNLGAPVVAKPNTLMDVALYTGNGSTQTISGLGFSPDFVWLRNRTQASNWVQFDTVRGTLNRLCSNLTVAEASLANSLTSFDSTGFTYGSEGSGNNNGDAFAAFCWDAGTSTVTNTAGSITSQVRANVSAGFSVATYTGNSTAGATIGHGLGVAPELIIVKIRTQAYNWFVYHKELSATKYIKINTTDAAATLTTAWNNTAPTSTVFSVGTDGSVNQSSATYVAYCFAPVVGYSSFGSFVPNGTADSSFVYCGFRPRFFMIKNTSATSNWIIWDTARDSYNYASKELYPNLSDAEVVNSSTYSLDILSNGFKVRNPGLGSGGTWIFAAWAEAPFQYARAR